MQANSQEQPRTPTFIETARRAQIVAAAIEVLSDRGYGKASMSAIARHAGLSSTGLISYHFTSKASLIEQVVTDVIAEISTFMANRVQAAPDPGAMLRAYIEGNVEFIGAHRQKMKALLEIFLSGGVRYEGGSDESVLAPVEEILRAGQQSGQFREFDVRIAAAVIQRAIETLPATLNEHPKLDLKAYANELVMLFERGLRQT